MPLVPPLPLGTGAAVGLLYRSSSIPSSFDGAVLLDITAGTGGQKGAWVQLYDSLPFDAYGIVLVGGSTHANTVNSAALLDVGVGPAGAEVVVFPDYLWGGNLSRMVVVPLFIPKGSRVAARMSCATDSRAGKVGAAFIRSPIFPFSPRSWRVYGVDVSNPWGVSVSSSGANPGPVTLIGTTSVPHNVILFGIQIYTTAASASDSRHWFYVGPNSTQVKQVWETATNMTTGNDAVLHRFPYVPVYWPLPSGTGIFAKINNGSGQTTTSRNIAVYCA